MGVRRTGVGDGHPTTVVVDVDEYFRIAIAGELPGEVHHLNEVRQNTRQYVLEVVDATPQ